MSPADEQPHQEGKIALALSGGGSRAMAFHLGCLRALRDQGLLDRISVISAVSGGSVVGALYCQTPGDFEAFETKTRAILARGLVRPALRQAFCSLEGIKALLNFIALGIDRLLAALVKMLLNAFGWQPDIRWFRESVVRRTASRTTILMRVFDKIFDDAPLSQLRPDRPKLIVVACELQAKSAFYFAADRVGSWRFGEASPNEIKIGHAVSASAAYPLFLPALDETMEFTKIGVTGRRRVILTDGGVYDNLGLAPLWPDRDPSISLHAEKYARIIACRAGYALDVAPASSFMLSRMQAAFESIFARSQNFAQQRLFDLENAGEIRAFLLPYLDLKDENLTHAPVDLVPATEVAGYGTNFSAMPEEWIERLVRRGEQVTHALLAQYWSEYLASGSSQPAATRVDGPDGAP